MKTLDLVLVGGLVAAGYFLMKSGKNFFGNLFPTTEEQAREAITTNPNFNIPPKTIYVYENYKDPENIAVQTDSGSILFTKKDLQNFPPVVTQKIKSGATPAEVMALVDNINVARTGLKSITLFSPTNIIHSINRFALEKLRGAF